jgi:inner membrane protein
VASVGHIAAALVASRAYERGREGSGRTAMVLCALSLAPDLDAIGFRLGVPYGAPWGHRGATHSLAMALVLATVAALSHRSRAFWTFLPWAVAVAVSHGVLDAMTDGGHGVAFLWPWSAKRIFFGWRPIPVAPIGARLLSMRGLRVALWPPKAGGVPSRSGGEWWRVLGAGAACGLLGQGIYDLVRLSMEPVLVAAPGTMVAGMVAAIVLSRVRRRRIVVAPLVGVVATALACATSAAIDLALNDPLQMIAHPTSWRDVPWGLALGLSFFAFGWMLLVPCGVVGGYLVARLVGPSDRMKGTPSP